MKTVSVICGCLLASVVWAWELADVVGDTTWLIRGGAAQRAIIHTCREAKDQRQFQIEYKDGSLVVKDARGNCFAALNKYGVAAAFSEGDPNTDAEPAQPLAGSQVVTALAASSKTAEQALAEVRKIFDAGRISGGQILFIADAKRAFVVECSPRHFAAQELTRAFCVYANSWKLPGMDETSSASSKRAYTVYQKEWTARELLRRALTAHHGITVADTIAVSRFDKDDVNTDEFFTPDTQVVKTSGTTSYFSESSERSAPYFDLTIDGITLLNAKY